MNESNSAAMRAKLRLSTVIEDKDTEGRVIQERLQFHGVSKKDGYDESGLDEDNTFAKFSPSVSLDITIANPALLGKFQAGQAFYVDFIPVEE